MNHRIANLVIGLFISVISLAQTSPNLRTISIEKDDDFSGYEIFLLYRTLKNLIN